MTATACYRARSAPRPPQPWGSSEAYPRARGDPADDDGWFATDWMDAATAQEILHHQHHSWSQMLAETAEKSGWMRYPCGWSHHWRGSFSNAVPLPRTAWPLRQPVGGGTAQVGPT